MPFLFDWASLGSANGSTGLTDGANSSTLTVASDPEVFFSGFFSGNQFVAGIPGPATSEVLFSTAVKNATFEIIDLDSNEFSFDERVTVLAFDVNGDPVPVVFSNLGPFHVQTGNTVEADGNASPFVNGPGSSDSLTVSIAGPVSRIEVIFEGGLSSGANTGWIGFGDISGDIVCFCAGTMIETPNGPTSVEALSAGDIVLTKGNGPQCLRWVGSKKLDLAALEAAAEKLRPVRISAGALGQGLPAKDLLVSRQHRMLVSSKVSERMFGSPDVLVSAIKLAALPGIYVDEEITEVAYFHLLFDQHEVIFADGAPSESLFTGPEAIKAISEEAREEIFALFPHVKRQDYVPETAYPVPVGRLQKKFVERHLKNGKLVLEGAPVPSNRLH
ncbi:Hint domain-containing protein [Ruegeria sp. R13_0]|uniref:Hint domain-containing protein n=1 Tax=Ruegeria sp. R13_0 TaxID=2821099 RepID=UPI001ADB0E0B|nr:Hint domain-containing protein [Ruegeria sp. R13_0]MBO9433259.1 Hint domain-containing protein [Ruegeria sp. R13_0]